MLEIRGSVADQAAHVAGNKINNHSHLRCIAHNTERIVHEHGGNVRAVQQILHIVVRLGNIFDLLLQLRINRDQLLIQRLQFFLRRRELLVSALQFFIRGLQLLQEGGSEKCLQLGRDATRRLEVELTATAMRTVTSLSYQGQVPSKEEGRIEREGPKVMLIEGDHHSVTSVLVFCKLRRSLINQ